MTENNTEEVLKEEQPEEEKMVLTSKQKFKKFGLEFVDMLKGAAFTIIVMCVFSSLIIMFSSYTDEIAVQLIAIIGGEGMLIAALVIFARTNGSEAYKTTLTNNTKRMIKSKEQKVIFKTGEYAVWKGFVIGFITVVPFIILQTIYCIHEYYFVYVLIDYSCGWAVEPFNMAGNIPQPVYFVMALIPIAMHGGFYIYGKHWEAKRQAKITRAEDVQRKGKKKHYYEENIYEKDSRYVVKTDKKDKKK